MDTAADRISLALEATITRFRRMVRSIGAERGLSEADLDELLQEVRIRLWRANPSGEQTGAIGTSYVYRAAVSAALDILRQRRAYAADRTESVELHSGQLPARAPGPQGEMERAELGERILAAVDSLQPARQAAVRMYLKGYERAEIEELMGWSEARTRNLLYRGLADLRERLVEYGITWTDEDAE